MREIISIKIEAVPSIPPVIHGMLCPRCKFPMKVAWTRKYSECIIRGRKCPRCDLSIKTTEEAIRE